MSLAQTQDRLQLPESLRTQLHDFRRRVWSIKMIEAVCAAAFGVVVAFLADVRARPRLGHARPGSASVLFAAAGARLRDRAARAAPLGLAQPPARATGPAARPQAPAGRRPAAGHHRAGATATPSRPARARSARPRSSRSPTTPSKRDFRDAVPNPRHRLWAWLARRAGRRPRSACSSLFPAAATNAWARLLAPWKDTPRYTFAAVEPLPDRAGRRPRRAVHGHGDARRGHRLAAEPGRGPARRPARPSPPGSATAATRSSCRRRSIPAGSRSASATRAQRVRVEPTLRPELTSVVADVVAARLSRPPASRSARTCAAARSRWSRGAGRRFAATASRELSGAQVDGQPRTPAGRDGHQPADRRSTGPRTVEFRWQDEFGLAGKEPFTLDDHRPRRRGRRRSRARTCRARRSCSTPSCSASRSGPRTTSASSASAWSGKGSRTRSSRRRPRASASWRPAATTRRRSTSAARSRRSRSASSRSRSTSASSPRITSPAGRGSIRRPTPSTCSTPSSTPSGSPSS